jgi:hypothetical protein
MFSNRPGVKHLPVGHDDEIQTGVDNASVPAKTLFPTLSCFGPGIPDVPLDRLARPSGQKPRTAAPQRRDWQWYSPQCHVSVRTVVARNRRSIKEVPHALHRQSTNEAALVAT